MAGLGRFAAKARRSGPNLTCEPQLEASSNQLGAQRIRLRDDDVPATAHELLQRPKHVCTRKIASIGYPHSHVPEPGHGCELGDFAGELPTWIRNRRFERRGRCFGRGHEHEVLGPSIQFCEVSDDVHRGRECYVGEVAGIRTVSRASVGWFYHRQ